MKTRLLTKSDLYQVLRLEQELFSNPFSAKSCEEELSLSSRVYVGIITDNQLVGYAGASIAFDSADIIKIGVQKSEQGKGFGKMLLNELLDILKQKKVNEVLLEVEHNNITAINMYLGAGFKEISERKNYYGENSHAKILRKQLNNEIKL